MSSMGLISLLGARIQRLKFELELARTESLKSENSYGDFAHLCYA